MSFAINNFNYVFSFKPTTVKPVLKGTYVAQVSVHLAERFQRRRLKCEKLTDDGRQVTVKAHIAFAKVS
jgi:hypothetical protein